MARAEDNRPKSSPGPYQVGWLSADVLEVRWHGRITGHDIERMDEEISRLFVERPIHRILNDTSDIQSFSADVRKPGVAIFGRLKQLRIEELVCVISASPVRMMIASLGFVTGLNVKVFASRREALAHLG